MPENRRAQAILKSFILVSLLHNNHEGASGWQLPTTQQSTGYSDVTLDNVHKRLLDNLKTGVVLLDNELRLRYINMEAEHLLAISDTKANNQFIGDLLLDAEEDIQDMRLALEKNISITKRLTELHLKHERSILVDYTINPFETEGELSALLEISSLEHSQRINREEILSSARATTQELVRGLAHEIKNPLGGIRGAAQLLASEIESPELHDYTNVIIEEADRLHNLVDRLVGARHPLEFSETNIHEVLERVKSLPEADPASANIEILTDYDPSIPTIPADAEQLIQAMLNLVRNAMQSINNAEELVEDGQIMLRTRVVRNASIGEEIHRLALKVDITDNGPGVPPHMLSTIFYPMISGRADGTGLGLPITHSIISQHKGMIECKSKAGQTVFSVILPLAVAENGSK